jgi:hypothetical protein
MFESSLDFSAVIPPDELLVDGALVGAFDDRQHSTRDFVVNDHDSGINPQATGTSQQSASIRGGEVSRIQSLSSKKGAGANQRRVLPGLFIRKDAVNSNFKGRQALVPSMKKKQSTE